MSAIAEQRVFDHQRTLVQLLSEFKNPSAVEVGVGSGRTSEYLLHTCPTLRLWMVDHWRTAPSGFTRKTQATYDEARRGAAERTAFASYRRQICHGDSVATARQWRDGMFDLVFVDAHHVYESVIADCRAWWPKVRAGGILCGHDIDSPKDQRGVWGVRRAVEEFSAAVGVPFTVDKNVWIMRRP